MKTLAVTLILLSAAGTVRAQDLSADLAPTGSAAEVEAGGISTDGNNNRMRELTRTPTWLWGTARAFVPLDSPGLWGQLRVEARTTGEGYLQLDGWLPDDSHLVVRLSRYRFPFAAASRISAAPLAEDASALDNLETSQERIDVSYQRAIGPWGGRGEVVLDFQRFAGTRPLLAGGALGDSPLVYSFGNPGYRQSTDWSGGAMVGYSIAPGGVRLRFAGGFRFDSTDDRLLIRDRQDSQATGLANLHDSARQRTVDLLVSAESDKPATLMAGGSYRLSHVADAPRTDRSDQHTQGSDGEIQSNNGEVTLLRHHGAAGLVWQPLPRLMLSGRIDARLTDLDGHTTQGRDLGTFEVVHADSSRQNWSLDGRLEGRYGLGTMTAVELDARGGLRRGQDDWSLRYLLADGSTPDGQRVRDLDRHLLVDTAELRLVTRLLPRLRTTLGARVEGLRDDQDVRQLVDAFRLGNRSRQRAGLFLATRSRLHRRLTVDGRASLFRNTWSEGGGKDTNWRFDVQLRASVVAGPLTFFAMGSLTDDRHDLSGAGQAQPGFATLDFRGRSWLGAAGASAGLARAMWVSATYTVVVNTQDLTTQLHDAALTGNFLLPWRALRLQVSARYLDFHDSALTWDDGKAVLGLVSVAGSF